MSKKKLSLTHFEARVRNPRSDQHMNELVTATDLRKRRQATRKDAISVPRGESEVEAIAYLRQKGFKGKITPRYARG